MSVASIYTNKQTQRCQQCMCMERGGDAQLFLQILEKANTCACPFTAISLDRMPTVVFCQMDKVHQYFIKNYNQNEGRKTWANIDLDKHGITIPAEWLVVTPQLGKDTTFCAWGLSFASLVLSNHTELWHDLWGVSFHCGDQKKKSSILEAKWVFASHFSLYNFMTVTSMSVPSY